MRGLYKRNFLPNDIIIKVKDIKFTVPEDLDRTLRENWKNKEEEIIAKGGHLYNGISYYLIDNY